MVKKMHCKLKLLYQVHVTFENYLDVAFSKNNIKINFTYDTTYGLHPGAIKRKKITNRKNLDVDADL